MKRAFIGAWLSLLGTLWGAGVIIAASQMLVNSWDPSVGRLVTTIYETGLTIPFWISILFIVSGVLIMAVEFFKKN